MIFAKLISNIKIKLSGNQQTDGVKLEGFSEELFEADKYQHFGFSSKAIKGTTFIPIYLSKNKRNIVTIASKNYKIVLEYNDGETILYSTDAEGIIKTKIYLKNDGTLELNGNTQSIVKGNELLTALQTLISEINSHTHTGNLGSPTSSPLYPMSDVTNTILSEKNFTE